MPEELYFEKRNREKNLVPKAVLEFLLSLYWQANNNRAILRKILDFVHIFILVCHGPSFSKILEKAWDDKWSLEKPSLVQLFLLSLVIKASSSESRKDRKGMRRYYKSRTRQLHLPSTNSIRIENKIRQQQPSKSRLLKNECLLYSSSLIFFTQSWKQAKKRKKKEWLLDSFKHLFALRRSSTFSIWSTVAVESNFQFPA